MTSWQHTSSINFNDKKYRVPKLHSFVFDSFTALGSSDPNEILAVLSISSCSLFRKVQFLEHIYNYGVHICMSIKCIVYVVHTNTTTWYLHTHDSRIMLYVYALLLNVLLMIPTLALQTDVCTYTSAEWT